MASIARSSTQSDVAWLRPGKRTIWRWGIVLLALLLLSGCYQRVAMSPRRAVALWRSGKLWSPSAQQQAKSSAGIPPSIALDQALVLALQYNPDLSALRAGIAEGHALIDEASQLDNPSLRLRDLRLDKLTEGEADLELGLRVPIPRIGIGSARQHLEELRLEEVQYQIKKQEDEVCMFIQQLFARLTVLNLDLKQVEETIRIREQQMKLVETRFKAGVATRLDLALVVLQHAESMDEQEEYRVRRADIVKRLIRLIGLPAGQEFVFIPDEKHLALQNMDLNEERLVERALAQRPDLREVAVRVNRAQNQVFQARAERWPSLRFAEVSYSIKGVVDPKAFAFSLGLELPLLSWNRGTISLREAELRRKNLEEQAQIMQAIHEISRAVGQVKTRAARVKKMEETLLPAVKMSTEVAADAIKHNVVDPMMASLVDLRRVRSQREHLKALLDYREAVIELKAALGDLRPQQGK